MKEGRDRWLLQTKSNIVVITVAVVNDDVLADEVLKFLLQLTSWEMPVEPR